MEKELSPNFEKVYIHALSQTEVLSRVKEMLKMAVKENGDKIENLKEKWFGNKNSFSFTVMGQDIRGRVEVKSDRIIIEGELPFAARLFKGKILKILDEQAENILT